MPTTTWRRDMRAAIFGVLEEFWFQNPDLLRGAHRARPEGFGELPVAWVGAMPETITHDSGTRQRSIRPTVWIADHISSNEEAVARLDVIVDELTDRYTSAVRRIPTSIIQQVGVEEDEIEVGDAHYLVVRLLFDRSTIVEGRS